VAAGQRAALVFCVQRSDARAVAAAREVDPEYAALLQQAARAGVELAGLLITVGTDRLIPAKPLPIEV
jgi:sugar fermentation stimulation protein A